MGQVASMLWPTFIAKNPYSKEIYIFVHGVRPSTEGRGRGAAAREPRGGDSRNWPRSSLIEPFIWKPLMDPSMVMWEKNIRSLPNVSCYSYQSAVETKRYPPTENSTPCYSYRSEDSNNIPSPILRVGHKKWIFVKIGEAIAGKWARSPLIDPDI